NRNAQTWTTHEKQPRYGSRWLDGSGAAVHTWPSSRSAATMTLATLLLFALASGITIATPGPTVLLAMSNGSRHGVRAAAWGMAGAVLADMILVAIVASGLGVLLAASEVAFQALKWAGAAYLAYLGWRLLRTDAPAVLAAEPSDAPGARQLFLRSFLVAITNPKALLFMSAFLPQFIDPAAPLLPQYLALAAVLAVLNLAAMLAYALLGARLMRALKHGGLRWLNRLCGGALIAMAATLALYRRGGARAARPRRREAARIACLPRPVG